MTVAHLVHPSSHINTIGENHSLDIAWDDGKSQFNLRVNDWKNRWTFHTFNFFCSFSFAFSHIQSSDRLKHSTQWPIIKSKRVHFRTPSTEHFNKKKGICIEIAVECPVKIRKKRNWSRAGRKSLFFGKLNGFLDDLLDLNASQLKQLHLRWHSLAGIFK